MRRFFYLRWMYIKRGTAKQKVGIILTFSASVIVAVFLSVVLYYLITAYLQSDADPAVLTESFVLGTAALYIGWLQFGSLQDLYDPQKFAPFPVAPRELFLGSCASTLLGPTPFFALGIWLSLIIAWPAPILTLATRTLLLLLLFSNVVFASRLVRLVFLQILTSRRWREAAVVIGATLSGIIWISTATARTWTRAEFVQESFEWAQDAARAGEFSNYLMWMPTTWWAWAFCEEGARAWIGGSLFLLFTLAIIAYGGRVEEKLAFSEPVFAFAPAKKKKNSGLPDFLRGWIAGLTRPLGLDIAALARKELLVLFRDPGIRTRIVSSIFSIVMLGVVPMIVKRKSADFGSYFFSYAIILIELAYFLNLFGTDGTGIKTVLQSPLPRIRILLAKTAAYAAIFLPLNMLIISVFLISFGKADIVVSRLFYHTATFLVALGLGIPVSIYFAQPIVIGGKRVPRGAGNESCGRMVSGLGVVFCIMILMTPILLCDLLFSTWLGPAGQTILSIAGILYGSVFYITGLLFGTRAFENRQENIAATFTAQ
ncbi:MAG: hypothetical protein ACKVS6_03175 [Planctomycetota bacterium]